MATYFFDQFDGSEVISDHEGQEIADIADLRAEATLAVRELIAIVVARGDAIDHRELRVRTSDGVTVMIIPFRDTLGID